MFKAWGVTVCVISALVLRLDAHNADIKVTVQAEALPINFAIEARLVDVFRHMLRASPTFRQQCEQLSRLRHLVVRIKVAENDPTRGKSRALTLLKRFDSGLVIAEIALVSGDDVHDLIAHELEHVLEFTDGFKYQREALQPTTKVWIGAGGVYETKRATEVGRRVAEEVAKHGGSR